MIRIVATVAMVLSVGTVEAYGCPTPHAAKKYAGGLTSKAYTEALERWRKCVTLTVDQRSANSNPPESDS